MMIIWLFIACREEGVCHAPEPLRSALEQRIGRSCSDIIPSQVKRLNLSNYSDPIEDASILSRFTRLHELRLSDTNISDLSFVSSMPKLSVLHLDHSSVRSLSSLSSANNLEELWLDYSKVDDLAPLSKLHTLRILTLRESKILGISALGGLSNLSVLDISNTAVFDISALKNGTRLQAFSMRNTQIDDISALKNHTELRLLDMRKTRVFDLSPLSSLSKLTALDAGQSRIIQMPTLPDVQELRLDGNPLQKDGCRALSGSLKDECVRSITQQKHDFLDSCIRRAQLSFHQETTIESLFSIFHTKDCTQLMDKLHGTIDLRGAPILDLRLLQTLPIDIMYIDSDWIWPEFCPQESKNLAVQRVCSLVHQQHRARIQKDELAFLEMCRNTTDDDIRNTLNWMMESTKTQSCIRLWMTGTQKSEWEVSRKGFSSLAPFVFFSNLKALFLDYNNISDISVLSQLPQLQIVWLDDNRIVDISSLRMNRKLLWLGLGDNEIEDLSVFASLPEIRRLWLGGNAIQDISSLSSLSQLRKLHLAGNRIQDVSPLASLPSLERLYLADNDIRDVRPLLALHNLHFLTVGLDYQESPLEAHHWLLRGNPIVECPTDAPLPIALACSFMQD